MTWGRALAHCLTVAALRLLSLAIGVLLGGSDLLLLIVILLVDDREIPEHQVGDEDLLIERPARVGELDVAETVDGPLNVDRIAGKVGRGAERGGGGRNGSAGRRWPLRLE